MQTKDLIEKTGLDRETLRFYEKKGIIQEPKRSRSGYREFDESTLERIDFTLMAKAAGFTLSEIKELLDLKQSRVSCGEGRDIALAKVQEIENKMKSLKQMKKILNKFIEACERKGGKGLKNPCHLNFNLKWRGKCD